VLSDSVGTVVRFVAVAGTIEGSGKGGQEEGFGDESGEGESCRDASCSNRARIDDTELAGEFSGSILERSDCSDLLFEGS